MADFDDFERSESPVEPGDSAPSDPTRWVVVIAALVAIAAVVGYVLVRRQAASKPQAPVAATGATASDVPLAPEPVTLPPLSDTDRIVRELVTRLSSHPKVLAWLTTNGLIENFTVVTMNIADGQRPSRHLRALALQGPFRIKRSGGMVYLDPRSYQRYDDYASAVSGLDAAGTARLYTTLRPRILDAYRQLGHPDADFDRVLEHAIGELLETPIVEGDIPLKDIIVGYEFADPDLEALSAAQKQFMRMGPKNIRTVQAKLREIATQLNLHPLKTS